MLASPSALPGGPPPSRVRYGVLTYLCVLMFVLYLDRVCIGQAGPAIQREMGLNNEQLGIVYATFTVSYGLFMAAAGRLGDRFGSRGVLIVIVIWWSTFTALTGACVGFWMLLVVRFIFGVGEAGALPNCARILGRWFPAEARGFPQGLLNMAMLVGGAVAPITVALMMQLIDQQLAPFFLQELGVAPSGWRWAFVLFGSVGLVWAVFFWFGYRDDPEKHPRVNAAELAFIRRGCTSDDRGVQPPVPWRTVFCSRNVWLMGLIMSCSAYCSYFYMSWFPKYLQAGRGVEAERSGLLSSLVLAGGALGSVVGGFCIDYVLRRTGQKRARPVLGAAALGLAGLLVLGSLACENANAASAVVALAFLVNMLMIASWWGLVSDISGRHGATLFGLMNSLGIVGAAGSQYFTGWLADSRFAQGFRGRDQWDPALYYMAGVLFIGMAAWLLVNPHRSAVEE